MIINVVVRLLQELEIVGQLPDNLLIKVLFRHHHHKILLLHQNRHRVDILLPVIDLILWLIGTQRRHTQQNILLLVLNGDDFLAEFLAG